MTKRIYGYISLLIIFILFAFVFKRVFEHSFVYEMTKQELCENYEEKENSINDLIGYFRLKTPKDTYVEFEITDERDHNIFYIIKDGEEYSEMDLPLDSPMMDSILGLLEWNVADLDSIRHKLIDANCISISNSNPARIGYKRTRSRNKYNYLILTDDGEEDALGHLLMDFLITYDNKCKYIHYRDNIILEYQGALFASKCFPDYFFAQ